MAIKSISTYLTLFSNETSFFTDSTFHLHRILNVCSDKSSTNMIWNLIYLHLINTYIIYYTIYIHCVYYSIYMSEMKEHRSLPQPKNIEINQLTGTSISLTLRTKAFLDESDDLVSLDTTHHSFPLQHHRDGKLFSREVLLANYIASSFSIA